MKVKFLIAALFFSLVAAAQPSNYIKFNTRGRWIAGMFDSTLHVPRFNGSPSLRTGGSSMDGAIAIDTTNSIMYFYSGGAWKRANLDTSAYAVTSVYRRSDSVFYVKGGVHTFAFKDSTGGGTPTFQQVLTAGSTLTTNHTINFGGNGFVLQGDTLDIKEEGGVTKIKLIPGSQSLGRDAQIYLTNADEWSDGYISAADRYFQTNVGWYIRNTIGDNASLSVNGSLLSGSSPQTSPLLEVVQDNETLFQVANDSIFFRPPLGRFLIDTLNYTLSTTGKKILIRDTATGLVQNIDPSLLGASSYTFTNGLTDSSGTVKLGGTLTEAITVLDGGVTNNLRFQDMQFEVTTSNTIMLGDSISFTGGSTPNRLSVIKLKNDTIKINPGVGLLYIDTLTSAVGTKALRYNPTTGLVSYADTTTGGSGGTPAGNNRNIQFNSNGTFAGNDSLKFEGGFLKTSNNVPLQIGGVNVINYDNNTNVTTVGGSAYITTISSGGYTVFGTNSKGAIDHTNGALTLGANIGDSLFTNNGSSHQVGNARFDARVNVAKASGYATNINGSLGANDFATKGYVDSTRSIESTYTPSLTNTTNISASTAYTTHYQRIDDVVHVWGEVDIDATTAATISEMGLSLPTTTDIAQTYDLAGTASFEDNTIVQIKGDVTNNRAMFRFTPVSNTNNKYSFHFTYKHYTP